MAIVPVLTIPRNHIEDYIAVTNVVDADVWTVTHLVHHQLYNFPQHFVAFLLSKGCCRLSHDGTRTLGEAYAANRGTSRRLAVL